MRSPTTEDILTSFPEGTSFTRAQVEAETERATEELEEKIGTSVRKRTHEETIFLRDRAEPLLHFPVTNEVRANDRPIAYSPATGIVYPEDLPPANYVVRYTTGYDQRDMPAIFSKAIFYSVRYRLLGLQEDEEEAEAAISIIRLGVKKFRGEREKELLEARRRR